MTLNTFISERDMGQFEGRVRRASVTLSDGCLKYPRDCSACDFRGKGANGEGVCDQPAFGEEGVSREEV